MKTKETTVRIVLFVSALLSISCVRDVVLDADEKPAVAVECVLSGDSLQVLSLNFTKGASKKEAKPLTEAVATLSDITNPDSLRTIGQFIKQVDGCWTLDYKAVPNHHYRLEIEVPGYDLIWAEDVMPDTVFISAQTVFSTYSKREENPDEFNYLPSKYAYYFEGTYYTFGEDFSSPMWIYGIDMAFEERKTRTGPIASEIYTDIPTADNFNLKNKIHLPEVVMHLIPNYKIIGVLVNNYPDLVGASMHDRFLRIEGGRANEPFLITCNFTQWYDWHSVDEAYKRFYGSRPMIFMAVSDTYDDYLKTALIMTEIQSSSDMSTIYFRDNLPSNIHGGVGIFGCKNEMDLNCLVSPTVILVEDYPKYGIDKETHKYIED